MLEAGILDGKSKPMLYCSSCWQYAVHPGQRGLKGLCSGFRRLSGGKALTARNRLQSSKHPTRPDVALGDGRSPSVSTRARWAGHFGESVEGEPVARGKIPPFLQQGPPPQVDLAVILRAFGFADREEAERIGQRALEARAERARSAAEPEEALG